MTRQERLARATAELIEQLDTSAWLGTDWESHRTRMVSIIGAALAALEQQAIDAYLSNVPLPEGWGEGEYDVRGRTYSYYDDKWVERAFASSNGVNVVPKPAHWPPIPLSVLIRAAVQCHQLREAGR